MLTQMEGKAVVEGRVEGRALVSQTPLSFLLGIDTNTGEIIEEGHEHQGESIAGRVLVYPYGKGSSGDCLRMWRCKNSGVAPVAIINRKADFVHVQGAIVADIPMVCNLDQDPVEVIVSGDVVRVEEGRVTVETGD